MSRVLVGGRRVLKPCSIIRRAQRRAACGSHSNGTLMSQLHEAPLLNPLLSLCTRLVSAPLLHEEPSCRGASVKLPQSIEGAAPDTEAITHDESAVFTRLLCNNKDRMWRRTKGNDGLYTERGGTVREPQTFI